MGFWLYVCRYLVWTKLLLSRQVKLIVSISLSQDIEIYRVFLWSRDFPDQLRTIIECLGTEKFNAFIEKYSIAVPEFVEKIGNYKGRKWKEYMSKKTKYKFIDQDALDLLDRLLRFDPNERLTSAEAMAHCYFD